MRAFHLFGCAAALTASAAQAQLSSTNCIAGAAGSVYCTTIGSGSYNSDGGAELGQDIANLAHRISERRFRSKISKLVAGGDCPGALSYAMEKGRYDAVAAIKQVCSS
jgi:hypothetical protein